MIEKGYLMMVIGYLLIEKEYFMIRMGILACIGGI
jgi:hypothetical protein